MISDDLSGLSTFLAVAEQRSFTAAAAALQVSPSAVSQAIAALEERVGARLLARTTRRVGLTEAGERFLSRVRPAVEEVRSAIATIDGLREKPAGLLRVNLSRLAARHFVEPIVDGFLASYPEVTLELNLNDAFVDLIEGGFDAGIRLGEHLDQDMVAVKVSGEQRMAVVGSPRYFARRKKPRHPRDLREHECINYRAFTGRRVYQWEFTENGRDFDIAVPGRYLVNESDLMASAALRGLGLAYLLESAVRQAIDSGKLVRVLGAYSPPFPGFYLYYPSRRQVPRKLQVFIAALKAGRDRRWC